MNRIAIAATVLVGLGHFSSGTVFGQQMSGVDELTAWSSPISHSHTIAFFGDSITKGGARPGGYCQIIAKALADQRSELSTQIVFAGIGGHKVPNLQKRLDRDVLSKKPTLVFIYIGINDVWHSQRGKGTPKDKFESGLRDLITRIEATGAGVVLCTPSTIGEKTDGSNELDPMLEEYAAISRKVAADTGVTLCDLRKAFIEHLKQHNPDNKEKGILTRDGVHLIAAGNRLVANHAASALVKAMTLKQVESLKEPRSLFNGKNLNGWYSDIPDRDKNPDSKPTFIVRDGKLVSLGSPRGHLITHAKFKDYRLTLEYRFAGKPGNCGVLVHASTPRQLYKMFPRSIEAQMNHKHAGDFWCIVEDITVPDMVKRRGAKENWGVVEGKGRRILNLTDDSEKPLGEWNSYTIECVDDAVKVWLNGDLVNHGTNCTSVCGQIALQAEGAEVEFRNLMIAPLEELSVEGQ